MIRTKGEPGTGDVIQAVRHMRMMKPFDGLILPGGESTVQGKLLKELDMYQILKQKIEEGLPVLATCAGMILLAENLTNDRNIYFATLPAAVKRNGQSSHTKQ